MGFSPNTYCLSCNSIFPEGAKFCHVCGQNRRASILSFKELWTNFWNTIFNVDNSFFNTLRLIPRADKITMLYVAGHRKKYINPIRLFLIMLVFLVAASLASMSNIDKSQFLPKLYKSYDGSVLLDKFDRVVAGQDLTDEEYAKIENLRIEIFGNQLCPEIDTIRNGMTIIDYGDVKPILKRDFIELTENEIYKKYGVDSYFLKLKYRQFLRLNKDPSSAVKYLFGNAGWGLIPSILLLCLFLKLLYRNYKIPYLEHLILVVNVHSFIFLIWIIATLFIRFTNHTLNEPVSFFAIMLTLFYPFFILYKYYREGFFISLIKYLLASIFYLVVSFVFIVISMLISGFIF